MKKNKSIKNLISTCLVYLRKYIKINPKIKTKLIIKFIYKNIDELKIK